MASNAPGPPDSVPKLLDYGCSPWRTSRQRAADLYECHVKFWTAKDMEDIEQQLARSVTEEKFTVRRIDGSVVHIKNPTFGVKDSIWKPVVQFHDYWCLIGRHPPDDDHLPETYLCSYLVEWENKKVHADKASFKNVEALFEVNQKRWAASVACDEFKSSFRKSLRGKTVTKIICFALGDLSTYYKDSPTQHAVALTMAEIARDGKQKIRLLAQDPGYTDISKAFLKRSGRDFEIVGEHGAGGFAEVDEQSVVFSAFPLAPVRQVIADIAHPAILICMEMKPLLDLDDEPSSDLSSPRTVQMMRKYDAQRFPTHSELVPLPPKNIEQLVIYTRRAEFDPE